MFKNIDERFEILLGYLRLQSSHFEFVVVTTAILIRMTKRIDKNPKSSYKNIKTSEKDHKLMVFGQRPYQNQESILFP